MDKTEKMEKGRKTNVNPAELGKVQKYVKQSEPPIDVVTLAKNFGLKVYQASFESDNISGKIERDERATAGYSIYVNQQHAEVRKRFTIAHEFAHYILHRDKIGDGVYDDALYRSVLRDSEEREANEFAAVILMPPDKIIIESQRLNSDKSSNPMDQLTSLDTAKLATIFDVSTLAMHVRLEILQREKRRESNLDYFSYINTDR